MESPVLKSALCLLVSELQPEQILYECDVRMWELLDQRPFENDE
jgi:hypothetical protein